MARRKGSSRGGSGGARIAPIRVESEVGQIELLADPTRSGGRSLLIDGLNHGYVDLADPSYLHLDYMARIGGALDVLLDRGSPASVLHIGGGAFSLPRWISSSRPLVEQTVIERSAAIVKLAKQHLRLRVGPQLHVVTADAAKAISRVGAGSQDLVVGDAFVGIDTPAQLAGAEFSDQVVRVLKPGGCYLLNLVDQPPWPQREVQFQLLGERFSGLLAFGAREVIRGKRAGNLLLLASNAPLPVSLLESRLAGGAHPSELSVVR